MNPVETYLSELRDIRSYGAAVEETSFYGTLETLLNEIGKSLKPKVRCIINLRNAGAGIPDGGLFTPDQRDTDMIGGQIPARGVVEVKGLSEEVDAVAETEQVARYLQRYGQVLVTNYRDFILIGRDARGNPEKLESYRLADNVADFKAKLGQPKKLSGEREAGLTEYLKRVMLRAADLTEPRDLAWLLASYARDARRRTEKADLPALDAVRTALEEALGLKFEGEKGEHFFRSTLVQTLFYGVFSAWVLWAKDNRDETNGAKFDWRMAAWYLHVPMIKALFEQVAVPTRLGPLGLVEILDWTGTALNRVKRGEFFAKFEEAYAVQYFYEPFLEAFDPELRKELGVWYTPPEIVEYMVERVDTVLREELGIQGGLANPRVYVLDPACGTGAYLVQVLKRIERTIREEQGEDALAPTLVKSAAVERIFGFEILPAPFVVAHLQLGLYLKNQGAELSDERSERAGVYLTNALTGWEPPTEEVKKRLRDLQGTYPELKAERDAADSIKHHDSILVILGNPPYNAFAGVSPGIEEGLVEPYKDGLTSEWGIKKFNLDDLYVRFFRLAERRIAEMSGRGIICYISNFSYLRDPSFVIMRGRFLREFDRLWFDNLNGDSRETGKRTQDGKPDPSIFSTEHNREGIRVGTAIAVMVRKGERQESPHCLYREFWGATKRQDVLNSLKELNYRECQPSIDNRFSFRPCDLGADYLTWPRVVDMCAIPPKNGLMEKRGGALIDIERDTLEKRMRAYYDSSLDWAEYAELGYGLTEVQAGFEPSAARSKVLQLEQFTQQRLVRYTLRAFDTQWCYYSGVRPLWNSARPGLWKQYWPGNEFFVTRLRTTRTPEGAASWYTSLLFDDHLLSPDAAAVPIRLKGGSLLDRTDRDLLARSGIFPAEESPVANLSTSSRKYLASLGFDEVDTDVDAVRLIWMHALAIGYSPAYLAENADGIRQDWPRIPLPDSRDALLASAELGKQIAALLDTENPVPGVTAPPLRSELRAVGVISREGGGSLDPGRDFGVTAGWGHAGQGGVTMPARGKAVERPFSPSEASGNEALLGETTFDIYLNETAYWKNVPSAVWNYHIGGYQVIKKWLSYREAKLLGRPLLLAEVQEVSAMIRRITAIVLLQPALDRNYETVKSATYPWPQQPQTPESGPV